VRRPNEQEGANDNQYHSEWSGIDQTARRPISGKRTGRHEYKQAGDTDEALRQVLHSLQDYYSLFRVRSARPSEKRQADLTQATITTPTGAARVVVPQPTTGIRTLRLSQIRPSPENDKLYRPINPDDPEIKELAKSIREHGLLQPLVITQDGYILSGHRRYAAAKLARLREVPCTIEQICRSDERFIPLLREHNRQREKTDSERLREEIVSGDPEESYRALQQHREEMARVDTECISLRGEKKRAVISKAKAPFLAAIQQVLIDLRAFYPLTDRQIHYRLLNNPPLIHASKPDSVYQNLPTCYGALTELLTRARLAGLIPMNAIADTTRPVTNWDCHQTSRPFIRREIDGFLKGFYRDLMQSQPNHIEIVGEKNTVEGVLRPVAMEYRLPLTIGRGYCSLPPRYDMAQRFRKSGKQNLILLVLSDFDPDGEEIAHSFGRSMRDDFGIENIKPIKVALTSEQVRDLNLPPQLAAKKTSSNYSKFSEKYGDQVFELEAVEPAVLQNILRESILGVIDIQAFNAEIDREKRDAAFLDGVRRRVHNELQYIDMEDEEKGENRNSDMSQFSAESADEEGEDAPE